MQIIATFVRMRIWPLQARAHPMWEYEGPNDSSCISPVELSANELASHVRMITCTKSSDPINIDCTITPYGPDRPFPEVKVFCFVTCLVLFCLSPLLMTSTLFVWKCFRDTQSSPSYLPCPRTARLSKRQCWSWTRRVLMTRRSLLLLLGRKRLLRRHRRRRRSRTLQPLPRRPGGRNFDWHIHHRALLPRIQS